MARPRVEVERDDDTGQEIVHFIRAGRHYLFLRDAVTRRFIRRLRYVEKRIFMVVEYSKEEAKKGNPLYIDAAIYTQLNAEEFFIRERIIPTLEKRLKEYVAELFGPHVAEKLLEPGGEEYGSSPRYRTKHEEGKATCVVVWKHHPDEPVQRAEEEVYI